MLFADRTDAGRQLGKMLRGRVERNAVVVGLPRGGVPVAVEVAEAVGAPLDVIVVRKLGVPFQPELAMGALGEGGVRVVDYELVTRLRISDDELAAVEQREQAEIERRVAQLRGVRGPIPLAGRPVVIVDDGIATGSTARAACLVARARGASRVLLATPVAPPGVTERFRDVADDVVCLATPQGFFGIGEFYRDFRQLTDTQVRHLLEHARTPTGAIDPPAEEDDPPARDEDVSIPVPGATLPGHFTVPATASGIVVFVHGSGSSRHSPRNQYVASILNQAGLGTLLFDLLTPSEEQDRRNVFDIELLAERLAAVTTWLRPKYGPQTRVGYFGASTGAAAALVAAARPGSDVGAVVSRGGRPDLAGSALSEVRAPTLLIVGGDDELVLELNRAAQLRLKCANRLDIVPGATHLFEEPGTLTKAAELAEGWFARHLGAPHSISVSFR
ncbi:MAG TPA: phosphoribosyltransferase family protein [Jatrophihabitans sp.]|nr:phosphoribosyltransferase family protein [Jatrophihabitans sp.]